MTPDYTPTDATLRLHESAIVFDGHCDALLDMIAGTRSWTTADGKGHVDLPRLRAGGLTALILAAFVRGPLRPQAPAETLRLIETLYALVEQSPDQMLLATTAEDVRRAKREGKVAAILGMEGADGVAGDLTLLRAFYRLGVRNIGLTHNHRNEAADGVGEACTGGGLTEFGVRLVQAMGDLGMMVDIAHLAPAGVADVFKLHAGPVVDSHANARAICNHRRNLDDRQLEQLAASGGVIGVVFLPAFIAENEAEASMAKLMDHIDHIVHVVGIDHVGLGSDWDGFGRPAADMPQDVAGSAMITQALVGRGYSDGEIRKILGENWLRVFEQVAG